MKQTIHLLFALLLGSVASADTNEPQYITMKSIGDVFSVSGSGIGFMMTDVPYGDWSQKQSGLYFPLNVSPVYSGLVAGVKLEKPDKLTPEKFSNQEKDFAEFVNDKNPNGARSQPPALKPGDRHRHEAPDFQLELDDGAREHGDPEVRHHRVLDRLVRGDVDRRAHRDTSRFQAVVDQTVRL